MAKIKRLKASELGLYLARMVVGSSSANLVAFGPNSGLSAITYVPDTACYMPVAKEEVTTLPNSTGGAAYSSTSEIDGDEDYSEARKQPVTLKHHVLAYHNQQNNTFLGMPAFVGEAVLGDSFSLKYLLDRVSCSQHFSKDPVSLVMPVGYRAPRTGLSKLFLGDSEHWVTLKLQKMGNKVTYEVIDSKGAPIVDSEKTMKQNMLADIHYQIKAAFPGAQVQAIESFTFVGEQDLTDSNSCGYFAGSRCFETLHNWNFDSKTKRDTEATVNQFNSSVPSYSILSGTLPGDIALVNSIKTMQDHLSKDYNRSEIIVFFNDKPLTIDREALKTTGLEDQNQFFEKQLLSLLKSEGIAINDSAAAFVHKLCINFNQDLSNLPFTHLTGLLGYGLGALLNSYGTANGATASKTHFAIRLQSDGSDNTKLSNVIGFDTHFIMKVKVVDVNSNSDPVSLAGVETPTEFENLEHFLSGTCDLSKEKIVGAKYKIGVSNYIKVAVEQANAAINAASELNAKQYILPIEASESRAEDLTKAIQVKMANVVSDKPFVDDAGERMTALQNDPVIKIERRKSIIKAGFASFGAGLAVGGLTYGGFALLTALSISGVGLSVGTAGIGAGAVVLVLLAVFVIYKVSKYYENKKKQVVGPDSKPQLNLDGSKPSLRQSLEVVVDQNNSLVAEPSTTPTADLPNFVFKTQTGDPVPDALNQALAEAKSVLPQELVQRDKRLYQSSKAKLKEIVSEDLSGLDRLVESKVGLGVDLSRENGALQVTIKVDGKVYAFGYENSGAANYKLSIDQNGDKLESPEASAEDITAHFNQIIRNIVDAALKQGMQPKNVANMVAELMALDQCLGNISMDILFSLMPQDGTVVVYPISVPANPQDRPVSIQLDINGDQHDLKANVSFKGLNTRKSNGVMAEDAVEDHQTEVTTAYEVKAGHLVCTDFGLELGPVLAQALLPPSAAVQPISAQRSPSNRSLAQSIRERVSVGLENTESKQKFSVHEMQREKIKGKDEDDYASFIVKHYGNDLATFKIGPPNEELPQQILLQVRFFDGLELGALLDTVLAKTELNKDADVFVTLKHENNDYTIFQINQQRVNILHSVGVSHNNPQYFADEIHEPLIKKGFLQPTVGVTEYIDAENSSDPKRFEDVLNYMVNTQEPTFDEKVLKRIDYSVFKKRELRDKDGPRVYSDIQEVDLPDGTRGRRTLSIG